MAAKTTKATGTALEQPIPFDELPADVQAKVEELAKDLDVADATSLLRFGISAQQRISEFAEQVLTHVRAKNVGQVRQHLATLLSKVKNLDLHRVAEAGPFDRVPILRHIRFTQNTLIGHYDKINTQLDKLVPELNASCGQLLKDVAFFDNLYGRNLEHLRELDAFIVAGDRKLAEWTAETDTRPARNGSGADARRAEDHRDRLQQLECFRKRLQHLQMARMISLQLAPQIRLIQDDLKVLVEETQNTVLTTIPLWKNQIVVAVAMMRQRETLRLAKSATKATTAMFTMNSDLIRSGSALIANRESEKNAVERDTLDKAGSNLVGPPISPRGRSKRNGNGNGIGTVPKTPRTRTARARAQKASPAGRG